MIEPALRPVFLGISHKMYLSPSEAMDWAVATARLALRHEAIQRRLVSLAVLPSFLVIEPMAGMLAKADIAVGAQDLHHEDQGAFTGAVSGSDLRQIGCRYAEVGHSERRTIFGEDEQTIRLKVAAALRNKLTPILCIGEPKRMNGASAQAWCLQQLESALGWLIREAEPVPLVIAYEPVWAIGQAAAADVNHVRLMMRTLRGWLAERPSLAGARLIYGGSAGPGTLTALGTQTVDGLFLGRFVHDVGGLSEILDEVLELFPAQAENSYFLGERHG